MEAELLLTNDRGIQIRGSVASLIKVDAGWESAISAALGSIADALVVNDATERHFCYFFPQIRGCRQPQSF